MHNELRDEIEFYIYTNQPTFTKRVLGANIECASMPLRYAFTSGMPDPAAAGAMYAQRAAAAIAKIMLHPTYTAKA